MFGRNRNQRSTNTGIGVRAGSEYTTAEKAKSLTIKYNRQWLYLAIKEGEEIDKVKELLEAGADITYARLFDGVKWDLLAIANNDEIETLLLKKWVDHYLSQVQSLLREQSNPAREELLTMLYRKMMAISDKKIIALEYQLMRDYFDGFKKIDDFLNKLSKFDMPTFSKLINECYRQASCLIQSDISEYDISNQFSSLLSWSVTQAKDSALKLKQGLDTFGLFWSAGPSQKEMDALNKLLDKSAVPKHMLLGEYRPFR